jgi:Arc/MetJ-type ribon-helix-helix transcriptional regulator
MTTLNISLPEKLRDQVNGLVKKGHFASVSDAIRTALRDMVLSEQLDGWVKDAKKDERTGGAVIIKNKLDLVGYSNLKTK